MALNYKGETTHYNPPNNCNLKNPQRVLNKNKNCRNINDKHYKCCGIVIK